MPSSHRPSPLWPANPHTPHPLAAYTPGHIPSPGPSSTTTSQAPAVDCLVLLPSISRGYHPEHDSHLWTRESLADGGYEYIRSVRSNSHQMDATTTSPTASRVEARYAGGHRASVPNLPAGLGRYTLSSSSSSNSSSGTSHWPLEPFRERSRGNLEKGRGPDPRYHSRQQTRVPSLFPRPDQTGHLATTAATTAAVGEQRGTDNESSPQPETTRRLSVQRGQTIKEQDTSQTIAPLTAPSSGSSASASRRASIANLMPIKTSPPPESSSPELPTSSTTPSTDQQAEPSSPGLGRTASLRAAVSNQSRRQKSGRPGRRPNTSDAALASGTPSFGHSTTSSNVKNALPANEPSQSPETPSQFPTSMPQQRQQPKLAGSNAVHGRIRGRITTGKPGWEGEEIVAVLRQDGLLGTS